MAWKQLPRWFWITTGVLILFGVWAYFAKDGERCERLMVAYEKNTADNQALARLNAECPMWESMR